MFVLADTEEVTYRINPYAQKDEHIINCYKLFGKVMGKAIFERTPMNAFLDKTILSYIIKKDVELNDIFYYDKNVKII